MNERWQFQVDKRPAGPVRETWHAAAVDAVQAGYAIWIDDKHIKIDTDQGGELCRLRG